MNLKTNFKNEKIDTQHEKENPDQSTPHSRLNIGLHHLGCSAGQQQLTRRLQQFDYRQPLRPQGYGRQRQRWKNLIPGDGLGLGLRPVQKIDLGAARQQESDERKVQRARSNVQRGVEKVPARVDVRVEI